MAENNVSADGLFEACAAGDLASVQTLLRNPAYIAKALETEERIEDEELQIARRSLNLLTMFNKAAGAGSSDLIKCLLLFAHSHGVPYETLIRRDSICAAISSSNSVSVFRELYAVSPDVVNIDMGHPGTPLSQAVNGSRNAPRYTADRTALVRFLLDHGANPNQLQGPDRNGPGTCLRTAVQRSSLEVIELLIQHGAQIEQSGAMHQAAVNGRIDAMDLLLRCGANVNEQLWTNLEFSARSRTKFKKEQGIMSDVSDDSRPKWSHETPLHYSVLHRQVEATAWLVKNGADASITDSKEWSAKDMATTMDDKSILEALTSSVET
ncbi:ankyrin [Plenodomus tracheiphilus IPT5]|uniref:Ankyrin n=1 Tax=Plenodomus tracheiphilus IPT5 TaxID=1408161 RepID=A0A6A7AZK1_9PLEO|nr:ankyrin [Plenodomus tracheiphilus IPT5]